ncbi:FixH family protein [Oryzibacter oryziterrae]|uniref:FixH family protein n=1 Tax=Oryzibacter oryziterrae TaxID=2766474 RepID=UPI001F1C552A|nr:FixH family protein [Oryzibacter oryziterrae]
MSIAVDGNKQRRLTGRAVLLWLIGFFGLIFAVNFAFVYFSISTFPGLEVESSYQAGQDFEKEVALGREQTERAWKVDASVKPAGTDAAVSISFVDKAGAPISGLAVSVQLIHAVDPTHDHTAKLSETAPGVYTASLEDVPDGSWVLNIEADKDGQRLFKSRNQLDYKRS